MNCYGFLSFIFLCFCIYKGEVVLNFKSLINFNSYLIIKYCVICLDENLICLGYVVIGYKFFLGFNNVEIGG